jgi:hypothetical protein
VAVPRKPARARSSAGYSAAAREVESDLRAGRRPRGRRALARDHGLSEHQARLILGQGIPAAAPETNGRAVLAH